MGHVGTRGPYAKTAVRRAEILRAARDSFAERGYTGSSLRDIAERAGTTHAVLQHHFATKDDLLTAVLAQRDVEEHQQGQTEVDGLDSFASYLGDVLLRHQEAPELMRLWVELAVAATRPGHPAHAYFVDRYERVHALLAGPLHDDPVGAALAEDLDPDSAAVIIDAILNGLQILWLLNPELDIVTPLHRFVDLVFPPDRRSRAC